MADTPKTEEPGEKKVRVKLAGHWSYEGKNYLPEQSVSVPEDIAANLRRAGMVLAE